MWREDTDLQKCKQGFVISSSFPENCESGIHEKVFDEIPINDLKANTGLDTLLAFIDDKLKNDDIDDSWEKFNNFEEYRFQTLNRNLRKLIRRI